MLWFGEGRKQTSLVDCQRIGGTALWEVVTQKCRVYPLTLIPLLQGLSEAEAKSLLDACGSIVRCQPGDVLVRQGTLSSSYKILLAGTFKSLTILSPELLYDRPGQVIGENGLIMPAYHRETVAATEASEALVLSGLAFSRFIGAQFDAADKIVRNFMEQETV